MKLSDTLVLAHIAHSYIHGGFDPDSQTGGCSCETCSELRQLIIGVRRKEAIEVEWCPIHGGLRDKGTPCMYCESSNAKNPKD